MKKLDTCELINNFNALSFKNFHKFQFISYNLVFILNFQIGIFNLGNSQMKELICTLMYSLINMELQEEMEGIWICIISFTPQKTTLLIVVKRFFQKIKNKRKMRN